MRLTETSVTKQYPSERYPSEQCPSEQCPSWCETDHRAEDTPTSRVHRAIGPSVPVIAKQVEVNNDEIEHRAEALDFDIGLSLSTGDTDTWISIGASGQQQIEVTTESARRLLDRIRHRLESAG